MKINGILKILIPLLLMLSFFCFAEANDSSEKSAEYYKSQYEVEKKKLPKLVFQLFYAVKESLDYGRTDGEGEQPKPKGHLSEYSRVTEDLIKAFNKEYQIEKYDCVGDDYVLIVSRKGNVQEKYKATRMEKFVLLNGNWESLGSYLYY